MRFTWKIKTMRFQTGQSLYLNKIHVGGYGWNSAQPQDNSKRWSGEVALPSLKTNTVYGETEEEIKTKLERIVSTWFKEVLKD